MTPETRYARAGESHIAYQVMGHAALDVVLAALKGVPDEWRIFAVTEG